MDVFPAFRRRDVNTRGRYTLLDNESDTTSHLSSTSSTRSSRSHGSHGLKLTLCDRCWIKHERKHASKRCLKCKQNLCLECARQDEVKRPWWLPAVLVQCWRFFFTKTFIPHSFVELDNVEEASDGRSWIHTQEASHVQPIPRVTRDSLRSNSSNTKRNDHRHAYDNHSFVKRQTEESPLVNRKQLPTDNIHTRENIDNVARSRSFEGFKAQRRLRQRRSRSVEADVGKTWTRERHCNDRYEKNWDDNDILTFRTDPSKRKVMKGKDIDIELCAEDFRLSVNDDVIHHAKGNGILDSKKSKCAVKKTKNKRAKQISSPEPYTEQIFSDHPIWFKRESSLSKTREKMSNKGSKLRIDELNEQLRQNMRWTEQDNYSNRSRDKLDESIYENVKKGSFASSRERNSDLPRTDNTRSNSNHSGTSMAYIVEEPPDPCPICLEDLPKYESRLLHCSHDIHTRCIREMLSTADIDFGIRCPVCKQMTPVKNYYAPPKLWYRELPVSTSV